MERPEKTVSEFNVTVPWGHIAVKAWGDEHKEPVLVVHGRMDNAGAFDNLIPLLPNSYYYVCIDLPGHGKSSHFPQGLPLYTANYILVYSHMMEYFKWKRYTILGHSYGGQIGLLYARLYPEVVEKLIMLDAIHIYPYPINTFTKRLADTYSKHLAMEKKLALGRPPVYTYEEALQRISNHRETGPITLPAAEALLKRALIKVGDDQYHFSLDQRMKNYFDIMHDFRFVAESLENDPVMCPTLMLLAKGNVFQNNYMKPALDQLKTLKNVDIHYVEGGHDVHNTHSDVMAPYIKDFMRRRNTQPDNANKHERLYYTRKFFNFARRTKILR